MNRLEIRLYGIEPLKNSASGNRVFRLHTDVGSFRTEPDSAAAGTVNSLRHEVASPFNDPLALTLLLDDKTRTVRGVERDGRCLDAAGDPI